MNSTTVLRMSIITSVLACLCSCAKPNPVIVQKYLEKNPIDSRDTNNPDYSSRVIESVFITAYLSATDATKYSGSPPFSVVLGAYSMSNTIVLVKIVSASVSINGNQPFDISSHFDALSMNTVLKNPSLDPAIYTGFSSAWIDTDKFLNAVPLDGDTVRVVFEIRVGGKDSSGVRKISIDFIPETHPAPRQGIPSH